MTLVQSVGVTDWELLNLLFPHTQYETEVVWLISNYIWFVWENIMVKSANVSYDKFFGYLTFKYRELQASSGLTLKRLDEFK